MNKLTFVTFCFAALLFVTSPVVVQASTEECTTTTSSYGQTSTTCKVLGATTETSTVNAGVGDFNFLMVAIALMTISGVLFGASRLTQKIYWFD